MLEEKESPFVFESRSDVSVMKSARGSDTFASLHSACTAFDTHSPFVARSGLEQKLMGAFWD